MRAASLVAGIALAAASTCAMGACTTKEPQPSTYFNRTIAPILQSSCVRTNTGAGCHVADAKGNAFGNLDLETFSAVVRRRDLLLDYGPYQQPSLLVKNVPPYEISVALWNAWDAQKIRITTDIKHTGLPIFDPTAGAYLTVRRWIEGGATEQNTGVSPVAIPRKACSDVVPSAPGFDPTSDPSGQDFALFRGDAARTLQRSCAAGNCHGTQVNALYLTCGQSPEELRWNYFAAVDYLAATPEESEIVRRPLATSQGGSYHEGGPLFESVMDPGYVALATWARAWAQEWAPTKGPPGWQNLDAAFLFFAQKVQPMLVKKGCMMVQCHSAAMFHDYRLRGGSAGSFSLATTRKNYALSVAQMSFESEDVNASRLVRKNLYRPDLLAGSNGIAHRGGPLFEDFVASDSASEVARGAACDALKYDYDNGDIDRMKAYCVIREWHKRSRSERNLRPLTGIVYVKRPPPPGPDRPQDFDVFAAGASLHIAAATQTATGDIALGSDRAIDLTACGLGSAPDIRRPAVSWDAKTIAFAARAMDSDPLAIYTSNADGTGCAKQLDIARHDTTANGRLEHDFDPTFGPPGADGIERVVFASTRGNLDASAFGYTGPQGTPADPTKPNANLYVLEPDTSTPGSSQVRQLTWQLNMERLPSIMQDGRIVFTAEKREPGFYQLALRRQNLDGGDYHPLFAQRGSIGYTQATYVAELSHKDFVAIFSNQDALHGAGTLGIFNRSLGVDFTSTSPTDYPVDPTVIDPSSVSSPEQAFFLHALHLVGNGGCYTSPSTLPNGKILVSFGAGEPSTFSGDYDLYLVDSATGNKSKLLGDAGIAEVDAVGIYARAAKDVFVSSPDEPNGHTETRPGDPNAEITVLDMPVLASLLFQNTPTGRVVEPDLESFEIYEDLPPDVTSFADCGGNTACDVYGKVYVRRRLLGAVPLQTDGSARFRIPGGLPIVLHLGDDLESRQMKIPRWQREEMTFVPGEYAHQSFPGIFFNNLCAGCHGPVSGRSIDGALRPDFLTQASNVLAVDHAPSDFTGPPSKRG
ncbi:MAG: hypothetical protein M3O46_02105, partial [Myxococcota bacterium]|nr:hypothetical protein [Myxococcota bacterium]